MAGQMTVGKKLTLGFAVVLSLTIVMGAACFVGLSKLASARDTLSERTAAATIADQVPFWTVKQYQNQADLIINKDVSVVEDFDESAAQMDTYRDQLEKIVDTPEEEAWFAKLKESDEAFDNVFRTKIVPEVEHQLGNYIAKYDGESDEYIEKMVEAAQQIKASLKAEVLAEISDNDLKDHLETLLAAQDMVFWTLKQYQNQADLIINRNMKSVEDFKASVAEMDRYRDIIKDVAEYLTKSQTTR